MASVSARLKNLAGQMKERRVWAVLVAYPSVTFVLLQAIEFFINNYGLDGRYLTAGLIIALVLFPAAFLWNWRHGEVGAQDFRPLEISAYLLFGVASLVIAGWYWRSTPPEAVDSITQQIPAVRTVAVLPLENPAGDAEIQYLCDGIAESLINYLAGIDGIRVVSKSAAFRMRDEQSDTQRLAEELKADSILRGKLEVVDGQVVVSAELVDVVDESQLWGDRLIKSLSNPLAMEREIVTALKRGLSLEVGEEIVSVGGTDVPEAYQHYLRGHYLIQATDLDSINRGLEELRAAIRLDPGFARPYADISDSLSQMLSYGLLQGEELLGEARNAAYTSVALAPDLAESQTAMATIQQYFEFDWQAADEAYEAAIALQPISPVPYHRYTDYLVLTFRFDRAREMALAALALDPLDSSSMHALGLVEMMAGKFPEAARAFGDWNSFHPNSHWSYVKHALALALDGQCDASLVQASHIEEVSQGQVSPLMDSWLAWGYYVCDNQEWYQRSGSRIRAFDGANPGNLDPGPVYLMAIEGDAESLVDMMERVYDEGLPFVLFSQVFYLDYLGWGISGKLETHPRYLELLDKIAFPPNPVRR